MVLTFTSLADPTPPPVIHRISTGYPAIDRALGGGLVRGATYLLAGDPGAGKSSLALLACVAVAHRLGPRAAAYVTAEQTTDDIRRYGARFRALEAPVRLAATDNAPEVFACISTPSEAPSLLVIDSLARMRDPTMPSRPGTLAQLRSVLAKGREFALQTRAAVIFIHHVTKSRSPTGPNELQHDVDAVLMLSEIPQKELTQADALAELGPLAHHPKFLQLNPTKNRFGSTSKPAVFALSEDRIVG